MEVVQSFTYSYIGHKVIIPENTDWNKAITGSTSVIIHEQNKYKRNNVLKIVRDSSMLKLSVCIHTALIVIRFLNVLY